jgi:tetratricopeptide (TPR) repeat protein
MKTRNILYKLNVRLCALLSLAFLSISIQPASSRTHFQGELADLCKQASDAIHRGEYEKALRLGEQCLSSARQADDRLHQASAYGLIGNACFYMDQFATALENFQAGLAVAREAGDRWAEATALKDIGITSKRLGRYDE